MDSEIPGVESRALFVTVDGSIGMIASLPPETFHTLEKVERSMEKQDASLGGLDHGRYVTTKLLGNIRWRAFTNGRKKDRKSLGFIDGDFVEGFLDLNPKSKIDCCRAAGIEGGANEVQRIIEELSRLH
jgi:DNA damage-binding protein 1